MEYKHFPVGEFKAISETPGRFSALVAVFNNVDDGGDRILPGAFKRALKENPKPPIVWSHMWNIPPIGQTLKAHETEQGLEIEGQLLLEDNGISGQYANSVHTGFKAGALQQFSFGYEASDSAEVKEDGVTIRELKEIYPLFEFSPTLIGMNRDTQLLEVAGRDAHMLDELADKIAARMNKGTVTYSIQTNDEFSHEALKAAIGSHSTGTTEGTWDGNAAMTRASNASDPAAAFRAITAWYSGSNPEQRSSYKFPHHNNAGGPAVLPGVRNALARVPQAQIPDSDRNGVEIHLNRHLDAAKSLASGDEAAAPSPDTDEKRAAALAEINRLKNLIPR